MSNYKINLQLNNEALNSNNLDLQSLIDQANSLPDAGGVNLPELTNEGSSSELFDGKQLIDQDGNVITGTFTIGNELNEQYHLITQIQTALESKVTGVVLPMLSNPATADNLEEGYELIDGDGNIVVGTHVCSGGGDEEMITFSVINVLPDVISIYGKICLPNETTVVSAPVDASQVFGMPFTIWIGSGDDGEQRDYYNNYSVCISYPIEGEDGEFFDETLGVFMMPQNNDFPFCALGISPDATPWGGECFTFYCEEV